MDEKRKRIWFSGVGELDAPFNGYKGRWLSVLDFAARDNFKIVTTSYVHSRQETSYYSYDGKYTIFNCGSYSKKRGYARLRYHWLYMMYFTLYLMRHQKKVDTIVFNAVPHVNVLGLLCAKLLGKKIILDVRDLWVDVRGNLITRFFARINNILFSLQVLGSDKVLVTSRKYIKYIRLRKPIFIPLGFDPCNCEFSVQRENIIGFIGNESPQYNLIDAIQNLKDLTYSLEFVGNFSEDYQRAIKTANPGVSIRFVGYLSSEYEKSEIMQRWSFGLIPNLEISNMGLPTKVFDYLKYRMPILYIWKPNTENDIEMLSFIEEGFGILHKDLNATDNSELSLSIAEKSQKFSRNILNEDYLNIIL